MSFSVLRTDEAWWVRVPAGARRIDTSATTTAELIADRSAVPRSVSGDGPTVDPSELELLSPVTAPCRVIAQMTNYVSHVRDSGMDPGKVPLTFFRKSSGSISGPTADIVKPGQVSLLDYEVEIGLVFGQTLPVGSTVDNESLAELVAGLVITNDVSARDVQLPKTQFYEAKSYPSFTPVGPVLLLLEPGEWAKFPTLTLQLRVNGVTRQNSSVADMIYSPLEAVRALTRFQRVDAGDLLLTGTPGGTALTAPPKPIEMIGALLPPHVKWKAFFRRQANNPKYLKHGDIVEADIRSGDGTLDLGTQRTVVREA
ncbi:fumarylacetoacetate hydrolase family protein [Gordonia hongkongensis]|uniref:Fumarylacetoacetate hydrolase family protein n=1 Tax=Gordonia hongkongensis TaxID=1701090 RepID=A0AAX3T5J6_9ACTN|nr:MULTISPECIES: fumarylacetoacetate hydrolase family protein [Gordonia]MBR7194102.1 fumarylacetoacetate hydrolase family protein [Gordonia sp. SCSIO 19800]MCX2753749.1 fumarylacetoacetate hydrolase family protein [Gordonia sp. 4N]QIK46547.1 fumarylacetoacetate hydrolase family protein [Gordonia terrae]WFP24456.1 fumarylacetoacetate hydrolase family protein [Gordonia hongkongensis]